MMAPPPSTQEDAYLARGASLSEDLHKCDSVGDHDHGVRSASLFHNGDEEAASVNACRAKRLKREKLRRYCESHPDDAKKLGNLAHFHLELDEVQEFVDLCKAGKFGWKASAKVLHHLLGRTLDALDLLTEVHRSDPGNSEVCCILARLQPEGAELWYVRATEADPRCCEALLALADRRRHAEKFGEAAQLYRRVCRCAEPGMTPARPLYRLGESLVKDAKGSEGRQLLRQVPLAPDGADFRFEAVVMMALSYVSEERHDDAFEYCRRAEEIAAADAQAAADAGDARTSTTKEALLKLPRLLSGVTHLRVGDAEQAIWSLQRAAECASDLPERRCSDIDLTNPADYSNTGQQGRRRLGSKSRSFSQEAGAIRRCSWDVEIQIMLGHAHTLLGDFVAAERHLCEAKRLGGGQFPGPSFLVNMAYLRQAQGDIEAVEVLLDQCLESHPNFSMALLRMGHLRLCQGGLEVSVQFLQKCLQQTSGTLSYGASSRAAASGAAHLYLCIAHHWRAAEVSTGSSAAALAACPSSAVPTAQLAEDNFRSAMEVHPDPRRVLSMLLNGPSPDRQRGGSDSPEAASGMLFSSSGSGDLSDYGDGEAPQQRCRQTVAALDLTSGQADVLRLYARRCGYLHASATSGGGTPHATRDHLPSFHTPTSSQQTRLHDGSRSVTKSAAGSSLVVSGQPLLLETTSTAAPLSNSPSRNASGSTLPRPPSPEETTQQSSSTSSTLERQEESSRLPPEKLLSLSDLELGDCLSHGEVAVVHRARIGTRLARDGRQYNNDVIVKMLNVKDCVRDEQAGRELQAEIAVMAELSHPRIVTFVGACLEAPHIALVTIFAAGGNLHHALHVQKRRYARHERFQLATELLEGVRYLHARTPPMVHLDLKSMNLVLDAEGRHLQICDFGLARSLGPLVNNEGLGSKLSHGGSPRYMAPECYDGTLSTLSEKADVWSSGCILIEIFGDELPYAECSNVQQILNLMLVHQSGPSIPTAIETPVRNLIACALNFDPFARLAIGEVFLRLQAVASSSENKSRFLWVP